MRRTVLLTPVASCEALFVLVFFLCVARLVLLAVTLSHFELVLFGGDPVKKYDTTTRRGGPILHFEVSVFKKVDAISFKVAPVSRCWLTWFLFKTCIDSLFLLISNN